MRPAFGSEEEATMEEPSTPAKKTAAKKSAAKSTAKKAAKTAKPDLPEGSTLMQEEVTPPAKRTRCTREEMEAAGAKSHTRTHKSIVQMRREAERLIAKADAAESKEILGTARNHIKELEKEAKELAKATAANTKALEKAKGLLKRLEGPGE
jgi:hypothetical protein